MIFEKQMKILPNLQIVMRCVDWTPALSNLIGPGVKQSGLWDSLDRTQVYYILCSE